MFCPIELLLFLVNSTPAAEVEKKALVLTIERPTRGSDIHISHANFCCLSFYLLLHSSSGRDAHNCICQHNLEQKNPQRMVRSVGQVFGSFSAENGS